MDKPMCATCQYWQEIDYEDEEHKEANKSNLGSGRCKAHPPMHVVRSQFKSGIDAQKFLGHAEHPITVGDSFCGEHPDFPVYLIERRLASKTAAPMTADGDQR